MDKSRLKSSGKIALLMAVVFLVLSSGGCETVKGFASGISSTAEGVGKDSYNLWNFIKGADNWISDNAW